MSYKEQLRAAHIASLKQKYLDAIAKSHASEEQNNAEHQEQSRELYISRKTAERDLPQQLRAKGLGGGAQSEDIAAALEEYRAKYDELKREQSEFSKK